MRDENTCTIAKYTHVVYFVSERGDESSGGFEVHIEKWTAHAPQPQKMGQSRVAERYLGQIRVRPGLKSKFGPKTHL